MQASAALLPTVPERNVVCPDGQFLHAVSPAAEKVPSRHAKHLSPVRGYDPAAHALQLDSPAPATRPLEHRVHAVLALALNLPAGQSLHTFGSKGSAYFPSPHALHVAAAALVLPVGPMKPAGQGSPMQTELPAFVSAC